MHNLSVTIGKYTKVTLYMGLADGLRLSAFSAICGRLINVSSTDMRGTAVYPTDVLL